MAVQSLFEGSGVNGFGGSAATQLPFAAGFWPSGQQVPHELACDGAQQVPPASRMLVASVHGVTHELPTLFWPAPHPQLQSQVPSGFSCGVATWLPGQPQPQACFGGGHVPFCRSN
jgi:hypothetical protein